MLTLVLTRHGHTERSEPEQYLGQHIDVPLSDAGRADARALGHRLMGVPFQRVISSPLRRALETAQLLRPDVTPETDARLAEADYGEWEGHTVDQIEARWPDLRRAWEVDPVAVSIPGGEDAQEVASRADAWVAELVGWEDRLDAPDVDHAVLAVAHSTLNRVLLSSLLGSPLRDYRRRFRQDWTNVTVLRWGADPADGPELLLCNDMSHVRGSVGATWG